MLVLTLGITACSDDNGGNGDNGDDDGDNLSDILFKNGTQLGNGADEMEINGNYKLPKGVYVMKGWLYITDGSSTIGASCLPLAISLPPGSAIIAALVALSPFITVPASISSDEPSVIYNHPFITYTPLVLCLLPTNLSVRVNPEIGEVLSCAEKR